MSEDNTETPAAETLEGAPATDVAVAEAPAEAAAEAAPPADAPAEAAAEAAPAEAAPPADSPADSPAETAADAAPQQQTAKPQRPRRRRPTAAERHRRTFFAKLSELRRAEQAAVEAEEGEAAEPPQAAAEPEAPATEGEAATAEGDGQPAAPAQPQPQQSTPPATSPSRSARAQARLVAAIERVGGHEAVLEALQPKRREDGETMKWSSVCCEQAQGVKPGDPTFTAWVRLAATPVRDVKAIVNPRGANERGRRGRGGRGRQGQGQGGGGGGYRGGGYRGDDRGGRGGGREDLEAHGRDGSFRSSVRIVNVEDSRREREEEKREQREAKRKAEAERLAKLGY